LPDLKKFDRFSPRRRKHIWSPRKVRDSTPKILILDFHILQFGSETKRPPNQAMDPVVLRLPRVDPPQDEPPFVLVHVSSAGSRPLDLDLIGTDNDSGFSVSCKVDHIGRPGQPLTFIFMR
jgi:hypothetical protein